MKFALQSFFYNIFNDDDEWAKTKNQMIKIKKKLKVQIIAVNHGKKLFQNHALYL